MAKQELQRKVSDAHKAARLMGDMLLCSEAPVDLMAAEATEGEEEKLPRFEIKAYTGGLMRLTGWPDPVVIDLAGMELPEGPVPVLRNHDPDQIVGHADASVSVRLIKLSGVVSGAGQAAEEVVASAKKGFPWRASVGARTTQTEYVQTGNKVTVNGMGFSGPLIVARRSMLGEVSFVPMGADKKASVSIAAKHSSEGEHEMDPKFKEWLEARGENPDAIEGEQLATLEAEWKASLTPPKPVKDPKDDSTAELRAQHLVEEKRILAIQKVCATFTGKVDEVKLGEIRINAIEDKWDELKAENELLKAQMPIPPKPAGTQDQEMGPKVLEAAIRMGGVEPNTVVEEAYPAEVLEKAYPLRGMQLKQLIAMTCEMTGRPAPSASAPVERFIEAAFSTAELTNLLGAVANKVAMQSYRAVSQVATKLALKLTANNFQTHTGVRMTGITRFDKVGADGELKHFALNEDTYTYNVDTYGAILALTRQQIVNDDLSAFTQIPQAFGAASARTLEHIFWTLVLANTGDFFVDGNGNLITTVLGSTGLSAAVAKLLKQTSSDGNPVALSGKSLAVPPELLATGQALYVSENLKGDTDAPEANVHRSKYEPVTAPHMSNTNYTGYSTTAWYLFAPPEQVAAFGIAYLRGNETPTFEPASLPGDVLGKGWRGYWDIGVCQIDHRGAVMSTGAG